MSIIMKKFIKHVVTAALTLALGIAILPTSNVHAQSIIDTETYNVGVSYVSPDDTSGMISIQSTERPSSVWDISSDGQYDFSGSSHYQTLYTNYKFKGKTSYKIYVKNTGSTAIKVKAKRLTRTYATTTVAAGKTATLEFSDIKSSTEFYIVFEADNNYSFSGYIK